MNTHQLTLLLSRNVATKPFFFGVFAEDTIQLLKISTAAQYFIIVNTAPSKHQGKHWLVLFKPLNGKCIFIDNFGHQPEFYTTNIRIAFDTMRTQSSTKSYEYIPVKLQSDTSNICGIYCVFFAYFYAVIYHFKKFF